MDGLYVASVTPFDKNDKINHNTLETLIRRNINEGAAGFFVSGSSAECFLLTEAERISILETTGSFTGETCIIAHIGATSTSEAIRYAKAAKSNGIKYIAAVFPFFYKFNNAQIVKYFYDISASVDMPLLIYNFPVNTGRNLDITDPDIRNLLCSDIIWGIKHTDTNLSLLERIHSLNPDLIILNGYEEILSAGLSLGAKGAIGASFNIMLPHFLKIYNAFKASDIKTMQDLQVKANNVIEALNNEGLVASIKSILAHQGIDAGIPRKPFTPLKNDQIEKVIKVFNENFVI